MNAETKIEAATLNGALVKALAEIGGATKDKVNPHFKSKYADLGSVVDAIKPVLAAHGLGFTQHCHPDPDGVSIETVVRHEGGEQESLGTLYLPANKKDAQGFGSAITYARRYALMTAFGVPAEDDDGNAAAASAPARTNGVAKVQDGQLAVLQGYADGGVIDSKRFCSFFQIPSLKDLPASRYDEALRMAQAKQEKQRKPEVVQ